MLVALGVIFGVLGFAGLCILGAFACEQIAECREARRQRKIKRGR